MTKENIKYYVKKGIEFFNNCSFDCGKVLPIEDNFQVGVYKDKIYTVTYYFDKWNKLDHFSYETNDGYSELSNGEIVAIV